MTFVKLDIISVSVNSDVLKKKNHLIYMGFRIIRGVTGFGEYWGERFWLSCWPKYLFRIYY